MKRHEFHIDFVGHSKVYLGITIALIAIGIISTAVFGVKLDIQFSGGTMLTYLYDGEINADEFAKTVDSNLEGFSSSVNTGEDFSTGRNKMQVQINTKDGLSSDGQLALTNALSEQYSENNLELIESSDVSASSGKTFFLKCLVAVIFSAVVLIVYIAIRFKNIGGWLAGICGVIALFHDIFVVYVTFVVFRMDIDANFMAVVLTILGYSINDTIVIYDRIRENKVLLAKQKLSLAEITNLSTNQSLTRSIYTSVTTIMSMLVVTIVAFVYGLDSIISFSFPIMLGMISGTYSTLCISTPLWVYLENKKKPKNNNNNKKKKSKPTTTSQGKFPDGAVV